MKEFQMIMKILINILFVINLVNSSSVIARNTVYSVDPGGQTVIQLKGYSMNGINVHAYITSLPTSGKLYQLSQVFSDYGYKPEIGLEITSVPIKVSGTRNRIVYKRPEIDSIQYDKYDSFTFTMNTVLETSKSAAIITMICSSTTSVVSSTFDYDIEGWKITGNTKNNILYQPVSYGKMNYYISGHDDLLNISPINGDDLSLWYFNVPNKFLGNQWESYGGALSFCLSSTSGDFSKSNLNNNGNGDFIRLECNSCNQNQGIRLVRRLDSQLVYNGISTCYRIILIETSQWLKDPFNSLSQWLPPSQCEMFQVLSALSNIQILGDFTKWYESVDLDQVELHIGKRVPSTC